MMSTRRSQRRRSRGPLGGGRRGKSLIIYGAIFFAIGLVITIGTYAAADSGGGGTYIVSWGPMLGGPRALIRGSFHPVRDRRANAQSAPGHPAPAPASAAHGRCGPPHR